MYTTAAFLVKLGFYAEAFSAKNGFLFFFDHVI